MPFVMNKEESRQWSQSRPNCDVCGQFIGVGGYFEIDSGIDGMGPYTVDYVLCKKHAKIEVGEPDEDWI